MTNPDRGEPEAVDSIDTLEHFDFCTLVEVKLITKVLSDCKELKLQFSPKKLSANVIRGFCLVNDYLRPWKTGSC